MAARQHEVLLRPPARGRRQRRERGGVALEYILVTTFAAVVGASLLGIAGDVFRKKLSHIAAEAGVDLEAINWNPFARED